MRKLRFAKLTMLVVAAAWAMGCAEGPVQPDPAVIAQLRQSLVLPVEPDEPKTPVEWREALAEEAEEGKSTSDDSKSSSADDRVVLVGQIGGMPNPWGDSEPAYPWRESQATFFLVDPATAAEFADHLGDAGDDHAANCAFCAREAANKASSIAAVNFLDEAGETIGIDARQLFDLAAGDVVVVRGKPRDTTGDLIVIDADGIFVRN